jgi:hypothetical protein
MIMDSYDLIFLAAFVIVWLLLARFIFPRFGAGG